MIRKLLIIIFLIILIMICFNFKEHFYQQPYEIRGTNLEPDVNLDLLNAKVYIGKKYNNFNLQTNQVNVENTLFVYDKIKIGDLELNYDKIKFIKKLPIHFKDKICLSDNNDFSCINKKHIKMLNGRYPFKLKTYVGVKPYRLYSQPKYKGRLKEADMNKNSSAVNLNNIPPSTSTNILLNKKINLRDINKDRSKNYVKKFKMPKNYALEFSIKPISKTPGWSVIFKISDEAGKLQHNGAYNKNRIDRSPAIWFYSNSYRLHIRQGSTGGTLRWEDGSGPNGGFDPTEELTENVETRVRITLINKKFSVYYSGILQGSLNLGENYCYNAILQIPGSTLYSSSDAEISNITIEDMDNKIEYNDSVLRYRSIQVEEGYSIKIYSQPNFTGESRVVEAPGIEDITKLDGDWTNGIVSYEPIIDNKNKIQCLSAKIFGPYQNGPPNEEHGKAVENIFANETCNDSLDQTYYLDTDANINNIFKTGHSHNDDTHFHKHYFYEPVHSILPKPKI